MKILLTGANGQVGWELARLLRRAFPESVITAIDREQVDLADPDAIVRLVREAKPSLIVNPAAYTAVDAAQSDVESAYAINARAPGIIAEEARRCASLLVHYSTDYVFDGTASAPYDERAQTNPMSVYGASKLAGEHAVRDSGCSHLVLRTSWVYGLRGKNFFLTMRRLALTREELRVVDDQRGVPNWCRSLAEGTIELLRRGIPYAAERSGLYHLSCRGETTWYEFARRLLRYPTYPRIIPITTADYPLPARRPAYAVLSTLKLEQTFGVVLPTWEIALDACLASENETDLGRPDG